MATFPDVVPLRGLATDHLDRLGATFLDIGGSIAHLLKRALAKEDVGTEWRDGSLHSKFHYVPISSQIFRSRLLKANTLEPRGLEKRACLGGCHEIRAGTVLGPRNRVMRLTDGTQAVLGQCKKAARRQHPVRLAEKSATVGYVHGYMLRIRAVECVVGVRQVLAVALFDRHPIRHADKRG